MANPTTVTWTNVTAIAPELSTVAAGTQTALLAYVNATLDEVKLRSHFTAAASYLLAHMATVGGWGAGGKAGPVTSHAVGDVSEQFAWFSPAGSDENLGQTPYGRMYRWIVKRAFAGGFVA